MSTNSNALTWTMLGTPFHLDMTGRGQREMGTAGFRAVNSVPMVSGAEAIFDEWDDRSKYGILDLHNEESRGPFQYALIRESRPATMKEVLWCPKLHELSGNLVVHATVRQLLTCVEQHAPMLKDLGVRQLNAAGSTYQEILSMGIYTGVRIPQIVVDNNHRNSLGYHLLWNGVNDERSLFSNGLQEYYLVRISSMRASILP